MLTLEGDRAEGDSDYTPVVLDMRNAEPDQVSVGDLYQVAVIRQAAALYLLLQLLDQLLVGVQLVHIVMREGEFGLEVAIVVKHVVLNDTLGSH